MINIKTTIISILILLSTYGCRKEKIDIDKNKVYTCLITQENNDAPISAELENTIGYIEWIYISEGLYHGFSKGAFNIGKTFVVLNNGVDGFISWDVRHFDVDFIELRSFAGLDSFGNPKPSNGCSGISLEIRVYD